MKSDMWRSGTLFWFNGLDVKVYRETKKKKGLSMDDKLLVWLVTG